MFSIGANLPYQLGFDYNLSAGHLSTPPTFRPPSVSFMQLPASA